MSAPVALNTGMMNFEEYMRMRERLWLADKNTMPGLSQIDNTGLLPKNGRKQRMATPVIPRVLVKPLSPRIGLLAKPPGLAN